MRPGSPALRVPDLGRQLVLLFCPLAPACQEVLSWLFLSTVVLQAVLCQRTLAWHVPPLLSVLWGHIRGNLQVASCPASVCRVPASHLSHMVPWTLLTDTWGWARRCQAPSHGPTPAWKQLASKVMAVQLCRHLPRLLPVATRLLPGWRNSVPEWSGFHSESVADLAHNGFSHCVTLAAAQNR